MPQEIVLRNSLLAKTKKAKFNPFKKKAKPNDKSGALYTKKNELQQSSLTLYLSEPKLNKSEPKLKSKARDKSNFFASRLNLRMSDKNRVKLNHNCCKIS
jgi:hypothetical protein